MLRLHELPAWTLAFTLGCTGIAGSGTESRRKLTRGDLGVVFETADEAAKAGCTYIWKHEWRATRIEYCGVIYRDTEGIKAGFPETNWEAGRCSCPFEPPETTAKACYHNHKQSEEFSYADRTNPTLLS